MHQNIKHELLKDNCLRKQVNSKISFNLRIIALRILNYINLLIQEYFISLNTHYIT